MRVAIFLKGQIRWIYFYTSFLGLLFVKFKMSTLFFAKNCGRTQDLNSRNFKEIGSKFPNDHCNIKYRHL